MMSMIMKSQELDMSIVPGNSESFTIPATTKVRVIDFVTVSHGSRIVARMDATFDFEGIPEEFHVGILNNLLPSRIRLHAGYRDRADSYREGVPVATPPSSPAAAFAGSDSKPWWKFW